MLDTYTLLPLSKVDCHYLDVFFRKKKSSRYPLNLTKVHGLLTAVISAPTLIKPHEWTALILGDDPGFETLFEAEKVMGLIIQLYGQISRQLRGDEPFELLLWDEQSMIPYDKCSPAVLMTWCEGYLEGTQLDPLWGTDKSATAMLIPFSVLAGHTSHVGEVDSSGEPIVSDEEFIREYRVHLKDFVQDNYAYWFNERESEVEHYKQQEAEDTAIFSTDCPCGSNKSFERCCFDENATVH